MLNSTDEHDFTEIAVPAIDFWFSIGSAYTYLAVMRAEEMAHAHDVRFNWRPFDVRAIMIAMDNVPSSKPAKLAYMWRDVERRAQGYGLPWSAKPPYPLKSIAFPNRVALVGAGEGWCADYVRAAYRRWFIRGQDASQEPSLSESLREIGQDPKRVLELAASPELKSALEKETETASALGIFGAPTFAVGHEIFWGDDRMEDAIAWSRRGD
jgi:2-hydroxychromene-2-carboxylate isomerase